MEGQESKVGETSLYSGTSITQLRIRANSPRFYGTSPLYLHIPGSHNYPRTLCLPVVQ